MKTIQIIIFQILFSFGFAQTNDSLHIYLTKEKAEALLLENNLALLANKLNIDKASAEILQAKLWNNPTLTIEEVNLWTLAYQRRTGEAQPKLFGSKYQQLSVGLNQLVKTASKRRKMVNINKVDKEIAEEYFKELMLNLRTEFRKQMYEFAYQTAYMELLEKQMKEVENLVVIYQKQFDSKNASLYDLMRLKASSLQLKNTILRVQKELSASEQELIILLNLPYESKIVFDTTDFLMPKQAIIITDLSFYTQAAIENNAQLNLSLLDIKHAQNSLIYQKALRTPDLNFSINYDRGGSIFKDFVGVGVSLDLAVFDRNKHQITQAKLDVEQSEIYQKQRLLEVQVSVKQYWNSLNNSLEFIQTIESTYEQELDNAMEVYTKHFKDRAVDVLTFMDFMETYIENKHALLIGVLQMQGDWEELNCITGLDFN